ncbi:MAG: sulfatase-like hydrolase/transferase [Planctomycetota bacterium]
MEGGPATGGARSGAARVGEGRLAAFGVLAVVAALAAVGVIMTRRAEPSRAAAPTEATEVGPAGPATAPAPPKVAPRPDVLVVAIDGLGPADIAAFGGRAAPTPALDGAAQRGVVYADAYATSPWAGETLASAVTGRVRPLSTDVDPPPTLAEELGHLGYRSALVRAHARHRTVPDGTPLAPEELGFDVLPSPEGRDDAAGARAGEVVDAAVTWLERSVGSSLLVVTLADPRPPHHRYAGLVAAADASYVGPALAGLPHDDLLRTAPDFTEADRARLEALHASEVAATDRAVQRLLDAVRARRTTPPVVAVVGLRAPALGRGGRYGLVPSLDPEDLRVPMVLELPAPLTASSDGALAGGQRAEPLRGVIDAPVSLVDLAPTLIDALGGTPRLDLDGRSVFPGARHPERPIRAATARGVRAAMQIEGDRALVLQCEPERARVHARIPDGNSDALLGAPRWERASDGVTAGLADLRGPLGAWMGGIGVARGDEPVLLRTAPVQR